MRYAVDMRLDHVITKGNKEVRVYWCAETSEYVVRFFENNEYLGEGPSYYTEDKADAIATAKHWLY